MPPRASNKRAAAKDDALYGASAKKQKNAASNKQANGNKPAAKGTIKASNQSNGTVESTVQNMKNGSSFPDVIDISEDEAQGHGALGSKVLVKTVCAKGMGFPRFDDGDIYIELSKEKGYRYWLHHERLSDCSDYFEELRKPAELNVLRSDHLKEKYGMLARYELQFDRVHDLWLLKQAANTYRPDQPSSSKLASDRLEHFSPILDTISQSSSSPSIMNGSVTDTAAGPKTGQDAYRVTSVVEAQTDDDVLIAEVANEQSNISSLFKHPEHATKDDQVSLNDNHQNAQQQSMMAATSEGMRQDTDTGIKKEVDLETKQDTDTDIKQGVDDKNDFAGPQEIPTFKHDVPSQSQLNGNIICSVDGSAEADSSGMNRRDFPQTSSSEKNLFMSNDLTNSSRTHQPRAESTTLLQRMNSSKKMPPTSVLEAYKSLFLIFYDAGPELSKTSPEKALSQAEDILLLAKYYKCLPTVRCRLSEFLALFGHDLFKAISNDPSRWLKVSVDLQDAYIFNEALIHFVGKNFNASEQVIRDLEFPAKVIPVLKEKMRVLKEAVEAFNMKMLVNSIKAGSVGNLLSQPGQDGHDTWFINVLWTDWFRNALHPCTVSGTGHAQLYRTISIGGQVYLDDQEVMKSYKALRGTEPSEAQQATLKDDMTQMKEYAQKEVTGLVNHFAMAARMSVTWLTCTRLDAGELPWLRL